MKNCREEWYDAEKKVAVTIVDVTEAAQSLARGHLAGPVASHYLTKALAAVALLGAETSEPDEVVSLQMKCSGPLGGLNVECGVCGELRGYTEKKILNDFDGLGAPKDADILGDGCRFQITRSVPGRIISQGLATSLENYFTDSLQRAANIRLAASVSDEVEVLVARGILVERLPDAAIDLVFELPDNLTISSRGLLAKLGLSRAELKKTTPLKFACRCSPERAAAMLSALSEEERRSLPPTVDITCHMCGKIHVVKTQEV